MHVREVSIALSLCSPFTTPQPLESLVLERVLVGFTPRAVCRSYQGKAEGPEIVPISAPLRGPEKRADHRLRPSGSRLCSSQDLTPFLGVPIPGSIASSQTKYETDDEGLSGGVRHGVSCNS